jgi:hypothetical protein
MSRNFTISRSTPTASGGSSVTKMESSCRAIQPWVIESHYPMADVDLMIAIGHLGDLGAPGPPYYDVDAEKKLHGRRARLKC